MKRKPTIFLMILMLSVLIFAACGANPDPVPQDPPAVDANDSAPDTDDQMIAIEDLPLAITILDPDSIGTVYMQATFTNNTSCPIIGLSVTVNLKDKNEKTYLSTYDTVLPGETSPIFSTFGPATQSMDDIEFLVYEITAVVNDTERLYVDYDCKLQRYDSGKGNLDIDADPPVRVEELPVSISIREPDSIGTVYMDATFTNNSPVPITGYSITTLLKDSNEKTYLSTYDTVLPGETSPIFGTFGPGTQSMEDAEFLKYEIVYVNDDGEDKYIDYNCKLDIYF